MAPETIKTISPATNEPILTRHGLSREELERLPKTAEAAFKSFSATSLESRQQIVQKALRLMREKQDELAKELTEQMGRPIAYGAKEITTAVARGEYMLKISKECLKDTEGEPEKGFKRYIKKLPLGPVLVLLAWNYPYLILVNSLIAAILAGDSVILKPSPQTPTVVEQAHRLFAESGLPKDVIQYFHCGSFSDLEIVMRAPEIKLICFTGSVAGGLAVQKSVSDKVGTRVGLELGGKDPAYVRGDVDIDWAADEIVDGAIFNSGQSCCSLERIYVDAKVHDRFVAAVQKVLAGYVLGDPHNATTNIGPVVSKRSLELIASHVQDALSKGAVDSTPGNESFAQLPNIGNYVAPRLLTNVNHDMLIMKDETFGPVIPVMKVSSDQEAVRLMNDSQFGLTASIWTKDADLGNKLADEIEAGTVFVNRADYPSPDLAWTAVKNSGKGQTLSTFGFDQFVRLKSYHVNIYKVYSEAIRHHSPPLPPYLAAVFSLTIAVSQHPLRTISETLSLLAKLSDDLKSHISPPEQVSCGTDLFQRQLSTTFASQKAADEPQARFDATKAAVLRAGDNFVKDGLAASSKTASYGKHFVRVGSSVFVVGHSTLVDEFIRHSIAADIAFRVFFVSSPQASTGMKERRTSLLAALEDGSVPTKVITIDELASHLSKPVRGSYQQQSLDMSNDICEKMLVLAGASAVYSDGSILGPVGIYTAACVAKAMHRPFWVLSETNKILSWFPSRKLRTAYDYGSSSLEDRDDEEIDDMSDHLVMDTTPSTYLSGIITERGPQSTSAIGEEAIRVWF
ncbi:MAG: hypothetical protein M1828_004269 [Chrysothrix sp. TS-e1954]|nr:MAG: hypothetical protein M1828_004269 [Chrysothrix sp. TS-e1954]